MFKSIRFLLFCCVLLFLQVFLSASDVVVVLDTSGSLLSYYDEINGTVLEEISTNFVRRGDCFHLISFNSSVHLEVSQTINSSEDFSCIVSKFLLIHPLAKDSDVLLALGFVKDYLSSLPPSNDKKLIFISDGLFTFSGEHYDQDDFEKELGNFSTYLDSTGKIQTYYIKLPISSDQIIQDLQNNLSCFLNTSFEMATIEPYSLIYNLPSSLKEYLQFDEIEGTLFKRKNDQTFLWRNTVSASEDLEKKELIEVDGNIEKGSENSEVIETEVLSEEKKNFEIYEKRAIEDALSPDLEREDNFANTTDSKSEAPSQFNPLSIPKDDLSTKEKKSTLEFSKTYFFLIVGILLVFVIFFIIRKHTKKQKGKKNIAFEEEALSEHTNIENSYIINDEFNEEESKNEILLSSTEEYLNLNEENKIIQTKQYNLREAPKVLADSLGVSKNISKEEKILLNVKTLENKLTTEYSPTFFTLSPDTKKAFAKGTAIENMISLLNASYIDSGDIFYRFKRSLYTKKYVKNIDITKKNYLEMFVANQRRSIGMRNIHLIMLNKTFYLGGGKRDDFLIFLVPIPRKLASIHYDEKEIVFKILEPKYFPYEKELEIRNPIDRFFVILSEKNYPIHFMFRIYEKEIIPTSSFPISK